MNRMGLCLGLVFVFGSAVAIADQFDLIDPEEAGKVYEKLPPILQPVKSDNLTQWACRDVYVAEHCGDYDGCTFKLMLQNKLAGDDRVLGINEYIYMENPTLSAKKKGSVSGYTRQSAGGEYYWEANANIHYTLFGPWGLVFLVNYPHSLCPAQKGVTGKPYTDPYTFTLVSHPHINTMAVIED